MSITKTDIANLAIARLGEPAVADIAGTPSPAPVLNRLFDSVVRRMQTRFAWLELLTTADWTPDDADSGLTVGYWEYALPATCLRVESVKTAFGEVNWSVHGAALRCGVSDITVEYVSYSDDPDDWSQELTDCVVMQLAADACMPIAQDANVHEAILKELHSIVLPQAQMSQRRKATNIQRVPKRHSWAQARRGY